MKLASEIDWISTTARRLLGLVGTVALLAPASAGAATFTVTTLGDSGRVCPGATCSIRAALAAAEAGAGADTVVVPAGAYSVSAPLVVGPASADTVLAGASANATSVAGDGTGRVLTVGQGGGLTVRDLTLRGGAETEAAGGDVLVQSQASLSLLRVRLTDGRAPQGGGLAIQGAARVDIASSLLDANAATGAGGGLSLEGQTTATTLNVQDSTLTANRAAIGGAFSVSNNVGGPITFTGVTLARNVASGGKGGGGLYSSSQAQPRLQNSIVAGNTTTVNLGAGSIAAPSNCTLAGGAADLGGNVETGADCGLAGHPDTDPQLSAALVTSASPPVLSIPQASAAVNVAPCPALEVSDQRGVPRPQGAACDAGAYEFLAAPNTTITGGPAALTNSRTASFTFTSNGVRPTFECSLDGAVIPGCSSPQALTVAADGAHTFSVRAVDATGQPDPSPATRTWTVDTVAPDTTITAGPSGPTNLNSPSFAFTSSEAGSAFQCSLDGVGAACTSPRTYPGLANGPHTFAVRAVDPAGNPDATPATRSFVVDTVAPDTTITSGPEGPVNTNAPAFTFSSATATGFLCRLDEEPFAPCISPKAYAGLADGPHTFTVSARDAVGNADSTPAVRSFTVDTTPPAATVVAGPDGPTTDTAPAFSFAAEVGTTLACRLDGPGAATGTFAPCASPARFSGLAPGAYVFRVRATDAAGNATETARTFTVTTVLGQTAPPPAPVFHRTVVVARVSGVVLVRLKGTRTFVVLDAATGIPLGSEIDARKGRVRLSSTPKAGGAVETADFYDGVFTVTQAGAITELRLTEALSCPRRKASAAAKKPKTRRLWGDGKGSFRTRGHYSAATVRGTKWLTTDTCTTTVIRVASGVVDVRNLVTKKHKLLRKGQRSTARARRTS